MSAAESVRSPGAQRIADAFEAAAGRAAFMPYLMSGYPDRERSLAAGHAYIDGGADLIEVGVPYSDPLADGPVIHAAGTVALQAGITPSDAIAIAGELAQRVPVVLMVYTNLVLFPGADVFAARLAEHGISGLIVPDLPHEETGEIAAACDAAGIALVPLVAPTTTDERMAAIGAAAQGFIYTVSTLGTTGERAALSDAIGGVVARMKAHTSVPVAVGFGIGTPEQAAQAAAQGADGVIVGTRMVRAVSDGEDIEALVAAFSAALAP